MVRQVHLKSEEPKRIAKLLSLCSTRKWIWSWSCRRSTWFSLQVTMDVEGGRWWWLWAYCLHSSLPESTYASLFFKLTLVAVGIEISILDQLTIWSCHARFKVRANLKPFHTKHRFFLKNLHRNLYEPIPWLFMKLLHPWKKYSERP